MRISGISSSFISSQKALTPFLIFVVVNEHTSPRQADVTYDSAIHRWPRRAPERALVLKPLSIKPHSERCLPSWFT